MKRVLFFIALILASTSTRSAQIKKAPVKTVAKPPVAQSAAAQPATEISAGEWAGIVKSLDAEDWNNSALLISASMRKLKTDNEKKQLARLRYFYLYSLAGKMTRGTITSTELERLAQTMVGQELMMPGRSVLADCVGKVNFVCAVKSDENSLRVTATNKNGASIHSFEYVKLPQKFDVAANSGKEVFLSGKLKKAEIGTYKQNIKILRLDLEDGSADLIAKQ